MLTFFSSPRVLLSEIFSHRISSSFGFNGSVWGKRGPDRRLGGSLPGRKVRAQPPVVTRCRGSQGPLSQRAGLSVCALRRRSAGPAQGGNHMRAVSLATVMVALASIAPASANEEVQKLTQDPNQWVIQTGDYANTRFSKLDQINAGNVEQAPGRLDVLDRRAARPRGLAPGDRRRHVRPHAVPEHRLCPRPQQRRQDHLEVRAEAGSERDPGDVLRHGQSRPRLCGRQGLPAPGRHHPRGARRQDRQGRPGRSSTATRRRARPTPRPSCR